MNINLHDPRNSRYATRFDTEGFSWACYRREHHKCTGGHKPLKKTGEFCTCDCHLQAAN